MKDAVFLPASYVPVETVHAALLASFQDDSFRRDLSLEAFRARLTRDDVNLAASQLCRVSGQAAGLALLAVRGERGWVADLGVAPEYRGLGLGEALMRRLMDAARSCGVTRLWLEVLSQNEPALRLYRKLGFRRVRQLLVLSRPADAPRPSRPGVRVVDLPLARVWPVFDRFHDAAPCWQRQRSSLERRPGDLQARAFVIGPEVVGELLFAPRQDTLVQYDLAVDPGFDRRAVSKTLLQAVHYEFPSVAGRVVSIAEDDPVLAALYEMQYVQVLSQYEMVVDLGGDNMGK